MIFTVFLVFALIFLILYLGWILRHSSVSDYKFLSEPVDTAAGENFPVFLMKMLLFILIIFVFMVRQVFDNPVFLILALITLYALILQLSGYRYK